MTTTDLADKLLTAANSGDVVSSAQALAEAAVMLMNACETGKYSQALEENMSLWIALKSVAGNGGEQSPVLAEKISSLCDYVTATTLSIGSKGLDADGIKSLISIDLEIASGFLDAANRIAIKEMAEALA